MQIKQFLILIVITAISSLITSTNSSSSISIINNENMRILQGVCTPENCPASGGFCKGDRCVCLEGYLTQKDPMNHLFCNYKQKNVMVGLLLECFGLIGFGHFYAGRIFQGLLKLILFYVIICYGSQFVIQFMKEASDTETAYYVKLAISTSCLGVPVIWHLIDMYKWATNQYLDGNELPMQSW
jgi:TM2 domain-containing membrane protein YozV